MSEDRAYLRDMAAERRASRKVEQAERYRLAAELADDGVETRLIAERFGIDATTAGQWVSRGRKARGS